MKDRHNFFRTRLLTHFRRSLRIQERAKEIAKRGSGHSKKDREFEANELKSDAVLMKLKYMPRNVFQSWTTSAVWATGKEQYRKKRSSWTMDDEDTEKWKDDEEKEKSKKRRKKKKRKKQFEKYDGAVVRTHKVLSLADLHVSVLNYPIPLVRRVLLCFLFEIPPWTSNTI